MIPDQEKLRQSGWEHAQEVVAYWQSEAFLTQAALKDLINTIGGYKVAAKLAELPGNQSLEAMLSKVHESHWAKEPDKS